MDDHLDIITKDGDRLTGDAARKYLDRSRMVADAIILERAVQVLERRFHESVTQDLVTAGTAHAWVKYAARSLRLEAEKEN